MILNAIIRFSVNNKLIVGLFTAALLIYGILQLGKLPIDAVPDITNNQVQVITVAPSLGATDIERLVTFPVEQANNNIPGLHEIRSFSRFGLSLVTIVFDDGVDIYWARQQVSERMQKIQAGLPAGIGIPELGPVTTGLGEIYQYVVRPRKGFEKQYGPVELRSIQDWIVRRQLLGVKGVADVSSFGGQLKQYEIAVKPDRLKAHGVSINDVFDALHGNNANTGGAYIEKGPSVLYIRTEGLLKNINDIESVRVRTLSNGSPVLIRDVANVRIGTAVRYGAMHYNAVGEVSGAVVMMIKGGNSSEVIELVKDRVAQIQKTLPEGVVIEPFLDRTKMVDNAIGTVKTNLTEGALIVVFVLVLFLGNFRAGLLVASVIPLSMLFAVIMMNSFHVSGNLMSLGALDFGLIVDGAVIIVEAVMHAMSVYGKASGIGVLSRKEMNTGVETSAGKMMNSAVFGQIIILIVYLPIFSLQGIEGKMFKPMAQTVAFALIGAFILSLTYIPMMSSLVLSRKTGHKPNTSDRMMAFLQKYYAAGLKSILSHGKLVLGIVFFLFVSAVFILTRLGGEFIPALEEGDFAIETRVLPGSNLQVSINASRQASEILLARFPEVEKVVAKIGSGEVPTDPMPIDAQDLMVILKDKKEWTSASTYTELSDKMGKALADIPGVSFGFQFPVQMRFNELMTGAKQDVVCKIFGEDLDTLTRYASLLGKISSGIEGAEDVYVEPVAGIPQIVVDFHREAIARYGLAIEDVNRAINAAFAGQSAGQVYEGEKRFDLVLRLDGEQRKQLDDVRNLLIPASNGSALPLYLLADVDIRLGPNQIQREDAKRRIIVGFNVRGRDMQSVVDDLKKQIEKDVRLPAGYYITYGGAFENLNAAKKRLGIAVPLALVLIFIMLYFAFRSFKLGLLIYSAIPLSAIGGVFALAARDMPFSISAGVGFIALFGVAVLNGIVLIAEFKRMSLTTDNLVDLVLKGSESRLRPVLMTAFVASLGFLPMALSNGAGAEVQRPLATVVIGGLLLATFLTLYVLPLLYVLAHKGQKSMSAVKLSIVLLVLSGSVSLNASAQKGISLKAALDSSITNNLSLRSQTLKLAYREQLLKTAYDLPQTMVYTEHGQINSIYRDNRFGVSQSMNFPTVYSRKRKVLESSLGFAAQEFRLSELELRKQMYQTYYGLLLLIQKERILMESDSTYAVFAETSGQRFKAGESNVLEKSSAEHLRNAIAMQLMQVRLYKAGMVLQFQLLMNTSESYIPEDTVFKIKAIVLDSGQLGKHPGLMALKQELEVAERQIAFEKSKLLPDISLSYSNMSMRGVGADNMLYGGGIRFQSVQLGIGIPVFSGAQKAGIKAAEANARVLQGAYVQKTQEMKVLWAQKLLALRTYAESLVYYEVSGLRNAAQMRLAAAARLETGDISYPEWVLLNNQSLQVYSDYFNTLEAYNQTAIDIMHLESFTNQ